MSEPVVGLPPGVQQMKAPSRPEAGETEALETTVL